MRIRIFAIISLVLGLSVTAAAQQKTALRTGWAIQSSCKVAEKGGVVSTPGFTPKGWYPATVPSTVLAALTADKVFPDPFFGMNLRAIPGTSYPIGRIFSRLPMPDDSPYRCSWWYRTEFRAPRGAGRVFNLHFGGINYRANVWMNGRQIADATERRRRLPHLRFRRQRDAAARRRQRAGRRGHRADGEGPRDQLG